MYVCANKQFKTLQDAKDYAARIFLRSGVILGIELRQKGQK